VIICRLYYYKNIALSLINIHMYMIIDMYDFYIHVHARSLSLCDPLIISVISGFRSKLSSFNYNKLNFVIIKIPKTFCPFQAEYF